MISHKGQKPIECINTPQISSAINNDLGRTDKKIMQVVKNDQHKSIRKPMSIFPIQIIFIEPNEYDLI